MKITAILSTIAAATLVSAGTFHDVGKLKGSNIVAGGYIIEYHEGISHQAAQNALNSRKIDYKVRKQYNIFNGAAIDVKSNHNGKDIASLPGVKTVWPISLYSIPKIQPSTKKPTDPEVGSLHTMTGVDIVHKKYKATGKGVKVGVIDTGIDYKHPAFAAPGATEGCFARYGKNCRVKYGWDFVGDDYVGDDKDIKADADPMDCQGHGTHVAGIIGADATKIKKGAKPPQPFIGVAPEVTFGAYRVFGCNGSASDDVILAAMELAFNDGMHVINMSLGGGSAYKYNPTAVLSEKLVAHGMAVIAAAGNDGSEGAWMVSDSGLGDLATSVASFDNAYGFYHSFTYGSVPHPYAPSVNWGKPITNPAQQVVPLFGKDGVLLDGCDPNAYKGVDVKGKIVLVLGDFTNCKSGVRATHAKTANASGMLVQSTLGFDSLGGIPDFPMASIENKAGADLIATFKKAPTTTITWSKSASNFLIEGGGAPSDFSSFGLDGELRSKPDIAGPGGNILSAYPLAKGGYAVLSGTSMATPYVAGAHALYMEIKGSKPRGDALRLILKNTATISSNAGSKTKTSVTKQGAGLVNVLHAIEATTSISPDHIDLLDSVNFKKSIKVTIKNNGKRTETYTLSHVPADALNWYAKTGATFPSGAPEIEDDYATVKFSQSKVKIAAGKSAKVTLSFKEPKKGNAAHFPIYSGFVVATPEKGNVPVHVPYTGLKGDVSKVPIVDTDAKFPSLVRLDNEDNFSAPPADRTFDLKQIRPVIQTRIGSHTPDFTIRVFDDKKAFKGYVNTKGFGNAVGYSGRDKLHDDEGNENFKSWVWEGKVLASANSTSPVTLPAGTYNLVVAAQRKFTKGNYPADYEVHDLGNVKISF
ncbi:MAG: peptidase S8/S53 domain-containing protein [Benniella sp.]|nr:MAG: peptidase S8/S53 domain-containing protein [Benniella sp.]